MTRHVPRRWTAPVTGRPVLVGVEPAQESHVVQEAAALARALGTGLVCLWVDGAHVVAEHEPDGTLDLVPTDSDRDEPDDQVPDDALVARLAEHLDPTGVPWLFVYATGEPVHGLREVAEAYDARLIAVGARRHGLGPWVNELIGGSIAGRLAHTQERPVLVVPAPRPGRPVGPGA